MSLIFFYLFFIAAFLWSIRQLTIYGQDMISWQMELTEDHDWHYNYRNMTPIYRKLFIVKDRNVRINTLTLYSYYILIVMMCMLLLLEKMEIRILKWILIALDP